MTFHFEPVSIALATGTREGTHVYRHTGVFDGCPLTVTYLVNEYEHHKRYRRGIGALTHEKTLAALLALRADNLSPVPARFLKTLSTSSAHALAVLIHEPNGRLWGQRVAGSPIEVLEIETCSDTWTRGAAMAHRWVGYGPRTVRLTSPMPEDQTMLLTEAMHYGLGVAAGKDGARVLEPGTYVPRRWTSARWRFAELVYEQFRVSEAAAV